jgi:hypothetical protein
MSILHEGENESVDWMVNLLQWLLLNKNQIFKVGGKEGMKVSRAAFSAILSLNQNDKDCSFTHILIFLDHIELSIFSMKDKTKENEVFEQLAKELDSEGILESFLERWEAASKMRIWLQEKRKDISNDLLEHKEKSTPVEEEKKLLIEEDKNEDIIAQEQKEIDALIEKIVKKAEFLINLSPPSSWRESDKSKIFLNISAENISSDLNEAKKTSIQKLKTIMEIQASKGSVVAVENLTNKNLFKACSTSVLAILQCSLEKANIVDELFKKLSNCIRRIYGLEIVKHLLSNNRRPYEMFHQSHWFSKAFRWNKGNELCHYSDSLDGVGEFLMHK